MITLSADATALLATALETAAIAKIDTFLFDAAGIRGMALDSSAFILHPTTELDDASPFAVPDVSTLRSQLKLFDLDRAVLQVEPHASGEFAQRLHVKSKTSKLTTRCADPRMVKTPSEAKPKPVGSFELTKEAVALIKRAHSSMRPATITFKLSGVGVEYTCYDDNHSTFQTMLATQHDCDTDLTLTYTTHPLLDLLTRSAAGGLAHIVVYERGYMLLDVDGILVFVVPATQPT